MKIFLIVFSLIIIAFLLVFIYCACRLASIIDEDAKEQIDKHN